MQVGLHSALNDFHIDGNQFNSQRQLSLSLSAVAERQDRSLPLNLCLIIDRSGSMYGRSLKRVKQAAIKLVQRLTPKENISIVAFDHRAKVLVPNQPVENIAWVNHQIRELSADGGTAIDEGLKLGIQELAKAHQDRVSQIFLLTDGENEHGDNQRCLKFAQLASQENITLNTLGFGSHWNQDILEKLADTAGGTLVYVEHPEKVLKAFKQLLYRVQSVGLTNAHLRIKLAKNVRLAEFKPIAQVAPDTIELPIHQEEGYWVTRLGDLMTDVKRTILVNLYIGQFSPGRQVIAEVRIRYDNPALGKTSLLSEPYPVVANVQSVYHPAPNGQVNQAILALAKYRQTQIAEAKLKQGDRLGAVTMLQSAAQTALQMGDQQAATVLQTSATQLQGGRDLTEDDYKKTRIVSKTILQPPN